MADKEYQDGKSTGTDVDNDYKTGSNDPVPVVGGDADAVAESGVVPEGLGDAATVEDDNEGIDRNNIVKDRTRGATKSYQEPGDLEGLEKST